MKITAYIVLIIIFLLAFLGIRSNLLTSQNSESGTYEYEPSLAVDWTQYHSYLEVVSTLITINETYPNIVDVYPIGKSVLGRTIYCVRLTNETNKAPKPEVFFVSYHHGCEQITSELTLYFVVYSVVNFGSNRTVTGLLNRCEIYVVVALNVDRLNTFEDSQERNNIKFRTNAMSVDLNRNYDFAWYGGGTAAFSEPETQALRDLVLEHNFLYAVSFHSGIELILYPWGHTEDPAPDEDRFVEISKGLSEATGKTLYKQGSSLYISNGTWGGWMYGVAGVFAFTCEIFRGPQRPGTRYLQYNPPAASIEYVVSRWLPVFFYIANRAITDAGDSPKFWAD